MGAVAGDRHVTIVFEPVDGAQGYRLHHSALGEPVPGESEAIDLPASHFVHDGLENGTTYHYVVSAVGRDGEGLPSPVVSATPFGSHAPLPVIDLEFDPGVLNELYQRPATDDSLLPVAASLHPDDAPLPADGLRLRGGHSRTYPKKNLHLRLSDRPELGGFNFRSEARRAGNRVLLNALWTDPTAVRERLAFDLYRAIGRPAPQTFFAEVRVDGAHEGLFLGLERIDREALRGWGLNRTRGSFTLVRDELKTRRRELGLSRRSTFGLDLDAMRPTDSGRLELLHALFDWRGQRDDQNWSALMELVRWVRNTPAGPSFAEGLAARFELDALIDVLALHALMDDTDSLDTDFWLYRDDSAEAPRWIVVPWDKNLTFGSHWVGPYEGAHHFFSYDRQFLAPLNNDLVSKLLATPTLSSRLDRRIRELLDTVFTPRAIRARIDAVVPDISDAMSRLPSSDAFVRNPQQHHGDLGRWSHHLDALVDFVELRGEYLRRRLNPVDDAPYFARLQLRERDASEVVFLTDPNGWVIARLELLSEVDRAEVTISVEEMEGIDGVDRQWTLSSDRPLVASVSLYYRNHPGENWYPEEVASGPQWRLAMAEVGPDGQLQMLASTVNPYSNRVTSALLVEGTTALRLVHTP